MLFKGWFETNLSILRADIPKPNIEKNIAVLIINFCPLNLFNTYKLKKNLKYYSKIY
jgi:hypothetical protein